MKYLAKSQNGKMIEVGEDIKSGKWYYFSESVKTVLDSLAIGDEVTYAQEQIGGAFHLVFLAKGTVVIPEEYKKKPVVAVATKATDKPAVIPQKPYEKKDYSKDGVDWDGKEARDFKGRCIMYASTILNNAGISIEGNEEDYLKRLFTLSDKLKEYIYTK
jgi:hypothetical protein